MGGCKVGLLGLVTGPSSLPTFFCPYPFPTLTLPLTLTLTPGVERTMWVPLSAQGEIEVGLTAIAFDTSGLHPDQRAAVMQGPLAFDLLFFLPSE